MGQMTGMDIEAVRSMGKIMIESGKSVEQRTKIVGNRMRSVKWVGKDRTKYQNEWNSRVEQDLKRAAQDLEKWGQKAIKQAKEQEQASAT